MATNELSGIGNLIPPLSLLSLLSSSLSLSLLLSLLLSVDSIKTDGNGAGDDNVDIDVELLVVVLSVFTGSSLLTILL